MHTGADPPPQRTPKLHGPRCPARPSPYLAGVVLRRRQRRRGGWAAQSHIVPGKGGRSQLRVTSATNNEGFDRRGARPARSPAPRPPTPTPRPAWPGPAPPPPGSDYNAAGPPQQPQCRSRPPRPAPPRSAPRGPASRAAAASGREPRTLPLRLTRTSGSSQCGSHWARPSRPALLPSSPQPSSQPGPRLPASVPRPSALPGLSLLRHPSLWGPAQQDGPPTASSLPGPSPPRTGYPTGGGT